MRREGHLQTWNLTLRTLGPLHVDSCRQVKKSEYLFDSATGTVSFLDEHALFRYLIAHDLVDAYEAFLLSDQERTLGNFLWNTCGLSREVTDGMVRLRLPAADTVTDPVKIHALPRNARGQVYIPGSTLKGALRTVLLTEKILDRPPNSPDPTRPFDLRTGFEAEYLHTLTLKRDREGRPMVRHMANSSLRGLLVADSAPLPDSALCLCRKIDYYPDGGYAPQDTCRECVRPGVEITFPVTLDLSVLGNTLTPEILTRAIARANRHYRETFLCHFPLAPKIPGENLLRLGGGVGFPSKTVVGAYYGSQAAAVTRRVLDRRFPKALRDTPGVRPRTWKGTLWQGKCYPWGVCEVSIR